MNKKTSELLIKGETPIATFKMSASDYGLTQDEALFQDMAEEYAIVADKRAYAGIIVYGKYNGVWLANPSARFLIRELLNRMGILTEKHLE